MKFYRISGKANNLIKILLTR